MGNVSSADHEKVNEPLARRARKKIGVIGDRKQSKQHDRLSAGYSTSPTQSTSPQEAALSPRPSLQKSFPVSANGPPGFTDDVNQQNRPLSQAEFYAKSLAENSPLTPTSPTTSFSIPSSAATAAPNSPTHDPYSVLFTSSPSTQDLPTLKPSLPITIPAMTPPGHPQQQQYIPPELIVPPLTLNTDDHAHYRQQQLHLSADLRHLGSSPEAKDWLKQKPTRSSAHMIHQYNFHSHQYYQSPGSVRVVNNFCRSMPGSTQVPTQIHTSTSPISGTDANASEVSVLTSAASKSRPTSITAAATAIASAELVTGQESFPRRLPAESVGKEEIPASGHADVGPRVPTLRSPPAHFDSGIGGRGHGHGITALNVSTHPHPAVSRSVKKEPRIGRLVMSRSKLNSPSVSSFSSAMSSSSSCHSTESTPGSPMDCESPNSQLRPCILPASVQRHQPPPPSDRPAHQNRKP
ncbi:unnamed protein product [Mortierella alpina]